MSFEETFEEYINCYKEHKEKEIKLKVIKDAIKTHYNNQEERLMKINGVVARLKTKKEYSIKEDIYDYLEDYGYLPLVVSINKALEKQFNLSSARTNQKSSVRLYTGGKAIVDSKSIANRHSYIQDYNLEKLSDEFKRSFTEEKLAKASLEEVKEQLKDEMPSNSISTDYGTLKLTESYDFDMNVVFDRISKNKEAFIKMLEQNVYEILIFPEKTRILMSGNDFLGEQTVEVLYSKPNVKTDSLFVKKRALNQYKKDGYVFSHFEIDIDPFEFFKTCKISMTKMNDLIQQGIIPEKDIEPFLEVVGETEFIEVLNEGSVEQQSSLHHQKLIERSQKYRSDTEEHYVVDSSLSSSTDTKIDIEDFNF
ncbi:hypothetical protein C1N61_28050 (plasmid) [Priestia aryabhattai]